MEKHSKTREETKKLKEDFDKKLIENESFEKIPMDISKSMEDLRAELFWGFDSLRRAFGISFEEFMTVWISRSLSKRGILPEGKSLERTVMKGEKINLFSEDPLIVGEVTAYAGSVKEIFKLLRKAEAAKKKYKKEPRYLFLRVLTAPSSVAKEMKKVAKAKNIDLVIGRES